MTGFTDADAFFDVGVPAYNDVTGIPTAFARESYRVRWQAAVAAVLRGEGARYLLE